MNFWSCAIEISVSSRLSLAIDNNAQIVSLRIDCLLATEISHLKISPGTSLNCTRISAFLESKALPAFMIKGTPAASRQMVLTTVQYQNSIWMKLPSNVKIPCNFFCWNTTKLLQSEHGCILPSHRSLLMCRMMLANVGVTESLGTVGSSL